MLLTTLLLAAPLATQAEAASAVTHASQLEPTLALQPTAVVDDQGQLQRGKILLLAGDRLAGLVDQAPTGIPLMPLDGVLTAGMIDAASGRGADRFLTEQSATLTPDLKAADGLNLSDSAWQAMLARGITAVHVVPDPTNPLAGQAALVACSGADGRPEILNDATVEVASLIQSAINDNRVGPSSLAGALELLRGAFARGEGTELPLWCFVEDAEGLRALAGLAGARPHVAILWGELGSYAGAAAGDLAVLPTFGEGELARRAASWRALHKRGLRFAFGTRGGNAEWNSLRTSAMALSRFTGDAAAAWQAVTVHPAEAIGAADELGHLAEGCRADLVLWSAHPLDATARVEAVMIGGKTVYHAPPQEQKP